MAAPEEVLAFPLTLYLAPVGTEMPLVDDDPADFDTEWKVLGTEGDENYDDSGVVVSHSETVFDFIPAGSTILKKRFRTGEMHSAKLNLVDLSPEQYAKVMNDAQITTVAPTSGQAGSKTFSLYRGPQVNAFAVLMRGVSPVDNDLNLQFQYPSAFVSVNGDATFNKGVATALPVEVMAADKNYGCVVQTHEAS